MIKTGSPRILWDHCIELEALIRSSTCNDIYMTNGKVPETIMTRSTADISHICEFGWYDWVMFRDNVPSFPDNKLVLGHYLVERYSHEGYLIKVVVMALAGRSLDMVEPNPIHGLIIIMI